VRAGFLEVVAAALQKRFAAALADPTVPPDVHGLRLVYGYGRDLRGLEHRLGTLHQRLGDMHRAERHFLAAVAGD